MRKLFNNITEWIVHIPDAFRKSETEDEFGIRLRKHKRAMYIRTALLVVLGIALIFVLINIYTHWTYRSYEVIESEDVFDSVSGYVAIHDRVLRYSPDGAVLLKSDMEEEIWNESFNMTQPTLESSSEAILIYDKRGTDIHVYNMEQKLGSFITNSPILFARVSANGNVLAAVEDGEGTQIIYYNSNGEEIAAISPSPTKYGYPLSMAVSEDGNMVAVSYVMTDNGVIGSRLAFYNFGSAGSDKEDHLMAAEEFTETLIPDVRYFGGTELIAFTDSGFMVYKGSGTPKRKEDVKIGRDIVSFFCDESRLAFIFRCDEVGHRYTMDVYNHGGKLLNTEYVDIIYDKGHFSNKELIFCNSNEMAVYTRNGHLRFSGPLNEGTLSDVIKIGRNKYFAVTDTKAEMIKLK